jgi:hypothetical protein
VFLNIRFTVTAKYPPIITNNIANIMLGIPNITTDTKKSSQENALDSNNPNRIARIASNNPEIQPILMVVQDNIS